MVYLAYPHKTRVWAFICPHFVYFQPAFYPHFRKKYTRKIPAFLLNLTRGRFWQHCNGSTDMVDRVLFLIQFLVSAKIRCSFRLVKVPLWNRSGVGPLKRAQTYDCEKREKSLVGQPAASSEQLGTNCHQQPILGNASWQWIVPGHTRHCIHVLSLGAILHSTVLQFDLLLLCVLCTVYTLPRVLGYLFSTWRGRPHW